MPSILAGQIAWVDGLPSPHNHNERKRRPALVLFPESTVAPCGRFVLCVAGISTSPTQQQLDDGIAIALPDLSRFSDTKSGLKEQSWAIADWIVSVNPCRIGPGIGVVTHGYGARILEFARSKRTTPIAYHCSESAGERCEYCK